ncbi:Uncharacterised protein [uncultured archaeon]|nr:Uncharacterised protein [uncultured archaeon]
MLAGQNLKTAPKTADDAEQVKLAAMSRFLVCAALRVTCADGKSATEKEVIDTVLEMANERRVKVDPSMLSGRKSDRRAAIGKLLAESLDERVGFGSHSLVTAAHDSKIALNDDGVRSCDMFILAIHKAYKSDRKDVEVTLGCRGLEMYEIRDELIVMNSRDIKELLRDVSRINGDHATF